MSLRFAIIKSIKTFVGSQWEDVIYEKDQDEVIEDLLSFLDKRLLEKRSPRFMTPKYTRDEVMEALRYAFYDTIEDFKRITLKIM